MYSGVASCSESATDANRASRQHCAGRPSVPRCAVLQHHATGERRRRACRACRQACTMHGGGHVCLLLAGVQARAPPSCKRQSVDLQPRKWRHEAAVAALHRLFGRRVLAHRKLAVPCTERAAWWNDLARSSCAHGAAFTHDSSDDVRRKLPQSVMRFPPRLAFGAPRAARLALQLILAGHRADAQRCGQACIQQMAHAPQSSV